MASVGGVSCDYVHGSAASKKNRVKVWTVPGLDGYGALLTGLGNSETKLTLVRINTSAAVHAWVALIEALEGSLVALLNDHGRTYSNFLVTRISQPRIRGVLWAGIPAARGELEIEGVLT